ncbi:MAG TPA: glycosyltransferase [Planctomycetota bacterium]|nr:glycosyltransferase [Planctomycetota bacterium]
MKLVVLTAAYPSPAEPERAVYIESLTRALAAGDGRRGAEPVDAAVVAPRVFLSDPLVEVRNDVPVRRFPYPSGGKRLKEMGHPSSATLLAYAVSGLVALLEEVRSRSPDAILCHWVLPTGPLAAAAASFLRVPLVLVAHGSDVLRYASSSRALHAAARFALGRASVVLAVSADLRRVLVEQLGVDPARAAVLPMGADERLFGRPAVVERGGREREEAKRKLGVDPSLPLLLFVGDLSPEKGVPELLDAHDALHRRGIEASLHLLGDGPLRGARRGASARAVFTGRVPQAELPCWHAAADLLVLPSHAEGSPVTVMEALSSGLPVLASRVGGIPDLIEEGRTGWLVPPRDAQALTAALEKLLSGREALEEARGRLVSAPPDLSAARRARDLRRILEDLPSRESGGG